MKLITSDEQLRKFIPNSVASARGELPLFERVMSFLELAENWTIENIISDKSFDEICDFKDENIYRIHASRIVVAEAMRRAIPSLDVVFTPNGFAVVQTSNLAPASKHRIDSLVNSMVELRDDSISSILKILPELDSWVSSDRATFFSDTLFNNIGLLSGAHTNEASQWDKYLELRPKIIDLEDSLADDWFSPELMDALRAENLRDALSFARSGVVKLIRAQILAYLKDGSFSSRRLANIIHFIRINESAFPEWHTSETAKLFTPPVFHNKKNSSGYFF